MFRSLIKVHRKHFSLIKKGIFGLLCNTNVLYRLLLLGHLDVKFRSICSQYFGPDYLHVWVKISEPGNKALQNHQIHV